MRFAITAALREAFSTISWSGPDAGYAGRFVSDARKMWDLTVAIVKRSDHAKSFVLLHRRSSPGLPNSDALVRDHKTLPATHEATIWTAGHLAQQLLR
jgi:hypothetical protein